MSTTAIVNFAKGEQKVQRIELGNITVAHNPRCPCRSLVSHLADENLADLSPIQLVHQLALSAEAEKRNQFVQLIEKYEAGPKEIMWLAGSRKLKELEPILLRDFRAKIPGSDEYCVRYGIVLGERRFLAGAYNFAKFGEPNTIGAVVQKITLEDAESIAFDENFLRQDMTEVEIGWYLRRKHEQINPESNKPYSLLEVASKFKLDYQYCRGREALTYLPVDLQDKLTAQGERGITKAIKIGLDIKAGKSNNDSLPAPKQQRQKSLNLKELEELFDKNRHRSQDYLEALAAAMRLPLEEACSRSDKRLISTQVA